MRSRAPLVVLLALAGCSDPIDDEPKGQAISSAPQMETRFAPSAGGGESSAGGSSASAASSAGGMAGGATAGGGAAGGGGQSAGTGGGTAAPQANGGGGGAGGASPNITPALPQPSLPPANAAVAKADASERQN